MNKELLTKALDFEKEGMSYFSQAKERSSNKFAKSIFIILEEQEKLHMQIIENIFKEMSQQGKWPEKVTVASEKTDFKKLFTEAKANIDKNIEPHADDLTALKHGLELEKRGREMYAALANEATDDNEKAFYKRMQDEEDKHYDFIDSTFDYFADSGLQMNE